MIAKTILQRLDRYSARTDAERMQALREITQEIVLAALGRSDFFKHALFQGGTCLRVFHGINRFSEDLDFVLRSRDQKFNLQPHLDVLTRELVAFGYAPEIADRSTLDATFRKLFIKDDSLGRLITLHDRPGRLPAIKIKIEIDTNPPAGSGSELKYLRFPFLSAVTVQDMPSLFAGKIHALLCRKYVKGRDWYDFIWYVGQSTPVNLVLLKNALFQHGPWKGVETNLNRNWLVQEIGRKARSLDFRKVADDVRRFVPENEQQSLDLWSTDMFEDIARNM